MKFTENYPWYSKINQLNHCSAAIYDTEKYYVLRSYATIIAVIDKETDICYDFLRLVYGYTATSAQHIRKFMNKYGIVRKKTWHD